MESVMLICFGISWPLNVYKNIKARSAKGMSLSFILMITCGYIAGISAKIIDHNYSYVLLIYIINLLFVSVNIVVYFVNRGYDREEQGVHHRHYGAAALKLHRH